MFHVSHLVVHILGRLVLCRSLFCFNVFHLLFSWCFLFSSFSWRLLFPFSGCFSSRCLFSGLFNVGVYNDRCRGRRTVINPDMSKSVIN